MMMDYTDVVVLGAGPAGLAAALSLAAAGVAVTLVAPPETAKPVDRRTTALLGASVTLLENLDIWPLLQASAAPLKAIRIVDDRRGLLRAPELLFEARELQMDSFGANVANAPLTTALAAAATASGHIRRRETVAARLTCGAADVRLDLQDDGTPLVARLVVAADGRNSLARRAAGIPAQAWTYPQSALAVSVRHARAHQGVSTELHRPCGPLTTVPLQGAASSLVWVEKPDQAKHLADLDNATFCSTLELELQGLLGVISEPGPRGLFPLSGLIAQSMGSARVALVGEAAHVMPPIGAQGLNLGLRDAATLAEIVGDACARGEDPGSARVLAMYDAARRSDVHVRQMSVDVLNRSLLSDFLPVQALRGLGLHMLANVPPLREVVMRRGMGPGSPLPRLMRRPQPASGSPPPH